MAYATPPAAPDPQLPEPELTEEQRATLAALNAAMPDLLRGFDEVLARFGIDREVHGFSTARAGRRDADGGCHMACCSCPPPEEACIEDCPHCTEPAVEATDADPAERPRTVAEVELSEEQRRTLERLNGEMPRILAAFDDVLARNGVERQVHRFTTAKLGNRDDAGAPCLMVCCRCPPPDEACTGHCSDCPHPDGGTEPIVV